MRNWIWVGFLGWLALVSGIVSNWALMQHVGWTVLGIVVLAYLLAWTGRRGVSIEVRVDRSRYTVGDKMRYRYRVHKRSVLPALDILLPEGVSLGVRPGGWRDIDFSTRLEYRGRCPIGGSQALSRDPFGLFIFQAASIPAEPILVYPKPLATPDAVALSQRLRSSQTAWVGESADATVGELRAYQSGDPPQRIHWRTSARAGRLVVSWPERRRRLSIWLLLDLGGNEEAVERAVSLTAFLVDDLTSAGLTVGLIIAGRSLCVVSARTDAEQRSRLLDALATAERSAVPRPDLIAREVRRVSDVGSCVLIANLPDADPWLRRLRAVTPDSTFLRPPPT